MLKSTISRKWTMLAVICAVILAVSLLFAGCGANDSNNITIDNMGDRTNNTTTADSTTVLATGGSATQSNSVYTANADDGYELAYWNMTSNSVTVKFATTDSVTATSGQTFEPVFVKTAEVTLVANETDLQTAMTNNANIRLTADIVTSSFTPVTTFSGMLDGAGHKITVNYTSSTTNTGGLCGTLTGVIKNIIVDGKITGTGDATQMVGGFAGSINGGLISQSENRASISGNGTSGGFVAQATNTTVRGSTINGCTNCGSVVGVNAGVLIYSNGTKESPLVNLANNKNTGSAGNIS